MSEPTDYCPTSEQARQIAALIVLPLEERHRLALRLADEVGTNLLAALLSHVVGMANSVTENTRDWLETEAIVSGDLHPDQAEKINTPSMLGAALGAEKAAQVVQKGLCDGCALRRGTMANQCVPTQEDVDWCERGAQRFFCHMTGLDDGEPQTTCPGWARWRALKEAGAAG